MLYLSKSYLFLLYHPSESRENTVIGLQITLKGIVKRGKVFLALSFFIYTRTLFSSNFILPTSKIVSVSNPLR